VNRPCLYEIAEADQLLAEAEENTKWERPRTGNTTYNECTQVRATVATSPVSAATKEWVSLMSKIVLGLFFVSSVVMAGCALEAADGEESIASADQALKAVVFKGVGNSGFSNESDKTATIAADSSRHASASGGIGIDLPVDDTAPFKAGSITSADCAKRTVTVSYKQADIQQFSKTSPPGAAHNSRCFASVILNWSTRNPAGTLSFPPPSPASGSQRVTLSGMPVSPAVGNITVVTKFNGVANNDKYSFRIDPAQ